MENKERQKYIQNKFKALRYAIAIFTIIIFLWWLQGGHIISFLRPQPSPAELTVNTIANIFKLGLANVFTFFIELFK